MEDLQRIIARLGLQPLPREGGWFRRYHVSAETDPAGRPLRSSIHFLMAPGEFSALHRLQSPETWEFRSGAPVELLLLPPAGPARTVQLGDAGAGEAAVTVPGGTWQGARSLGAWSLVDCTMAPAWVEREFELGDRAELIRRFPAEAGLIAALTR